MGLKRFIRTKILEPIFGKDTAGDIVDFAVTEAQKAVAVLKTTEMGGAVSKIVADLTTRINPDGSAMSGAQKFAAALADVTPLVASFLATKGAIGAAVDEVEDIARELIQSVYNDTKSTTAGSLAGKILTLFGVKI